MTTVAPPKSGGLLSTILAKHDALYTWVHTTRLGGPRCLKMSWYINLQKGGTVVFCCALMHYFGKWDSPTALTYTALHGSYGLLWLLKEMTFPDPSWQQRCTLLGALVGWSSILGPYWSSPYLLMSRGYEAPAWKCAAATLVYVMGVCIMMGADGQKYFVLQAKQEAAEEEKKPAKKGLISNGFFSRIRHPNYLGEIMLYGSFAWLSGQIEPWCHLLMVWVGLFLPNMLKKEKRMSRHSTWKAYCVKAGFLWPKIF